MTLATADEDDDADNCGNDDTEKDAVDDDDDGEKDEEHATDKNAGDDDDDDEEEEEENTDENAGDEPDGEDLATLPLGTELASNNLTIWRKWSSMIKMITVDNDCRDD